MPIEFSQQIFTVVATLVKRLGGVGLTLSFAACASPPARFVPFVSSPTFESTSSRVLAIRKAETNQDGKEDVLTVVRAAEGLAIVSFEQGQKDERVVWDERCESDPMRGNELLFVGPVELGRRLFAVVSYDEDPEVLVQHIGMVAMEEPCDWVHRESVRLAKPDARVVGPAALRAGVAIEPDGQIAIREAPVYLKLHGEEGAPIWVLREIGVRTLTWGRDRVTSTRGTVNFLHTIKWEGRVGEVVWTEKLAREEATLVARAGEALTLEMHAQHPVSLLVLEHGCGKEEPNTWVAFDGGKPSPLDVVVSKESHIAGVGRGQSLASGRRDLLLLEPARDAFSLTFANDEQHETCVRRLTPLSFLDD